MYITGNPPDWQCRIAISPSLSRVLLRLDQRRVSLRVRVGARHVDISPATVRDKVDETSNIVGLTVPENSHVLGITDFTNEVVSEVIVNKGASAPGALLPMEDYQDVKKFFERPRLIASYVASTTRNSIASGDYTNPITFWWPLTAQNRLNGVLGYRCTVKFTLTAAFTPFQQGLVALAHQYGASTGNPYFIARDRFPPLVTNLPHARMNFADETMCEITVPYMSAYDYFELANTTTGGGDQTQDVYGRISVNQILPYTTLAGSSVPTMRLYVSLHDMELFGAVPVTFSSVLPQSGVSDAAQAEHGIVSNTLNALSTASNSVGTIASNLGIPTMSKIANKAGWLAKVMSKTAQSYGYSKPVDQRSITRVFRQDFGHDHHVDEPSPANVLGPFQSNMLATDAFAGATDIDEMALGFILSQYGQCFVTSIATSDTAGTLLYATCLCPTAMWFKTNTGRPGGNTALPASLPITANCLCPTPLCYISNLFKYWRGSLKFRFTFAKTRFHAGRVLASFVPNTFDNNTDAVISNACPVPENSGGLVQPFQYSKVFDLKDGSSFEFEVPYVASRPWLSVFGYTGGVSLAVLDPLITTGSTAGAVPILIEVAAGDDFELGCYTSSGLTPYCGDDGGGAAIFQSGSTLREISEYTMGEKITSLKQLIMIPSVWEDSFTTLQNRQFTLPPWHYGPQFAVAIPMANASTQPLASSIGHYVARMYAFGTGGTEYHAYTSVPNVLMTFANVASQQGTVASGLSDPRSKLGISRSRITSSCGTNSIHVKLPSYQRTPRVPLVIRPFTSNWSNLATSTGQQRWLTNQAKFVIYSGATAGDFVFSYAASDDARCMGYCGPPPVFGFPSTTTTSPDSLSSTDFR